MSFTDRYLGSFEPTPADRERAKRERLEYRVMKALESMRRGDVDRRDLHDLIHALADRIEELEAQLPVSGPEPCRPRRVKPWI